MAEFVQTMKDWRRMCKVYTVFKHECEGCPLENIAEHACGAIFEPEFADVVDWVELKKIVDEWAAEHPEPVYETWFEYLLRIGVIPDNAPAGGVYQWIVESIKNKHITEDIAKALNLQAKEEQK